MFEILSRYSGGPTTWNNRPYLGGCGGTISHSGNTGTPSRASFAPLAFQVSAKSWVVFDPVTGNKVQYIAPKNRKNAK